MLCGGFTLGVMPGVQSHVALAASSAGCGRAWTPGSNVPGTLSFGGLQRTYLLHIPRGYNPTTPTMLVFNLPGTGMTAQLEDWLTHMSSTADAQNFLLVYPQGTGSPLTWNAGVWGTSGNGVDDVGFLSALVSSLEGQLCVDTTRIDVTGMSIGAVMTYHVACSDVPWLAAIAPVAGTIPTWQGWCHMAHPTPLLAINGERDPVVSYNGPWGGPAIPSVVATWAKAVGCPSTGQTGFSQGDVVETVYSPCTNGADTELYSVTDGGHAWPGGYALPSYYGFTSSTIDASSVIAAFFAAHPLH